MLRRLMLVLAAIMATIAPLDSAHAAPSSTYVHSNSTSYVIVRSCPTTTYSRYCYQLASLPNDTRVSMFCYIDGDWAKGNYWTNRWFGVRSASIPGGKGFIHASLVFKQTKVSKCQATDISYL